MFALVLYSAMFVVLGMLMILALRWNDKGVPLIMLFTDAAWFIVPAVTRPDKTETILHELSTSRQTFATILLISSTFVLAMLCIRHLRRIHDDEDPVALYALPTNYDPDPSTDKFQPDPLSAPNSGSRYKPLEPSPASLAAINAANRVIAQGEAWLRSQPEASRPRRPLPPNVAPMRPGEPLTPRQRDTTASHQSTGTRLRSPSQTRPAPPPPQPTTQGTMPASAHRTPAIDPLTHPGPFQLAGERSPIFDALYAAEEARNRDRRQAEQALRRTIPVVPPSRANYRPTLGSRLVAPPPVTFNSSHNAFAASLRG